MSKEVRYSIDRIVEKLTKAVKNNALCKKTDNDDKLISDLIRSILESEYERDNESYKVLSDFVSMSENRENDKSDPIGMYPLADVFESMISELEGECYLTTNDDGETSELSVKVVDLKDAIEIVRRGAELCKNGHFGCNSNGEHEKCRNCGVYDCKIRNTIWFGCKEAGDWILCEDKMPTERDSIFKKFKGTDIWSNSMFERISDDVNVTVEFEDGSRKTMTAHTMDGEWRINLGVYFKVIAWKPLPEYYRG